MSEREMEREKDTQRERPIPFTVPQQWENTATRDKPLAMPSIPSPLTRPYTMRLGRFPLQLPKVHCRSLRFSADSVVCCLSCTLKNLLKEHEGCWSSKRVHNLKLFLFIVLFRFFLSIKCNLFFITELIFLHPLCKLNIISYTLLECL